MIVGKGRLQQTLTGGSNLALSSEEEKKKKMLTKMLVEVYISSGRGKAKHAAKVLTEKSICFHHKLWCFLLRTCGEFQ